MEIVKNLPFRNVAANSVASLEMPLGMTYGRIVLKMGGTSFVAADIDSIVCKLNGKEFYELTGTQLDKINQYRGLTKDAAYIVVDFTEPLAKTVSGMYGAAIPTMSGEVAINSFTMTVTIGGATAPTLESWSYLLPPRPHNRDTLIMGFRSHPQNISAAGKFPIVLPYGAAVDHLIKRVHFFHANMTYLEVKKNGVMIYEEVAEADMDYFGQELGRSPQTGLYVYDPVFNMDMKRVVSTVDAQSMQFNVTVSGADTITAIEEIVAPLAQF